MLKKIKSPFGLVLILNAFIIVLLILRYGALPPEIPLFYSMTGESSIADLPFILILPLLSIILIVVNTLIVNKFFSGDIFLEKVIYYVNIVISLVLTFIFIRIIFLVS